MVTQKAISARINNETLWQIHQETMLGGDTRNSILNKGARLYVSLQDTRRNYRMFQNPEVKRKVLEGFLRLWFPEAANLE